MPAWWKGKSKSKSKSISSPRTKELETPRTPLGTLEDQDEVVRRGNKEKDNIFGQLVSRKSGDHPIVGGGGARGVGGAGTGFMFGYPLPLPSEISLQGVPAGLAPSSALASSNSSSGSSDERPDLASYR